MSGASASLRKVFAATFLALLAFIELAARVDAHEVLPSIADFSVSSDTLAVTIRLDIEALMAGMDLSSPKSESKSDVADYEALRALPVSEVEARFAAFWPVMADKITIKFDGVASRPALRSLTPPANAQEGLARQFTLDLEVALPAEAQTVVIGWDASFGPLVLRQNGVDAPYDGYLDPGMASSPIHIAGGDSAGGGATFLRYIPIGFDHIVPKGLDHILFILGLFLFANRLRPLLLQISAFTAAHTVTLAAASLNFVTVPSAIIEPAIAASIIYVAVENILSKGQSAFRLPVIFCFGLVHGLGFASVLQEFGLPGQSFVAGLLGFNLGVEIGQLAVIAAAFLLVGVWFNRNRLYRSVVVIPGSAAIGIVGAVWFIQRVT